MLRGAQHMIVEAAAILGASPEDGGLWEALALIAGERSRGRAPDRPCAGAAASSASNS